MQARSKINYKVTGSKAFGHVIAPPSKSHTMRAVLLASLLSGRSVIKNPLNSPDVNAMINACRQMGAIVHELDGRFEIIGVNGKPSSKRYTFDAGNSGQVLRFVGAICALIEEESIITGDASVKKNRPVSELISALNQLGGDCDILNNDCGSIRIRGPVQSGKISMSGEDSQPVSALLMLAAFLNGTTEIHVHNPGEKPWIDLTLFWLNYLGVRYERVGYEKFIVHGGVCVSSFTFTVPGDFSSIAYPLAAAIVTKGQLSIAGLARDDVQGDKKIIGFLQKMGAHIDWQGDNLHIYGDASNLCGQWIDVNDCIDALPILSVIACFAKGETQLVNAGIARKKESDRLAVMTKQLRKMGGDITELPDQLIIHSSPLKGTVVQSHNDHRVAMSLVVAGLGANGCTVVQDVSCVNKSYPDFYHSMKLLRCNIEVLSEYHPVRL